MRGAIVVTAAALAAFAPGAAAGADPPVPVSVQFEAFGPSRVDLLPGQTVEWDNGSGRTHTVTADDGSFDSGTLDSGTSFTREFDATGTFAYHCTIHPTMTGEVDVEPVILGPLPTAAVPAGDAVEFSGRTSDPSQPVLVQRGDPSGFVTVASVTPAQDGSWKTSLPAEQTGDYRASIASGASEARHLIVSDRKVLVHATRRGVSVTVTPALPYARVVLEQRLRARFGWWPVQRARLDYVSQTSFRLHHPGRVRVVLVAKDGWTPIATSLVAAVHKRG